MSEEQNITDYTVSETTTVTSESYKAELSEGGYLCGMALVGYSEEILYPLSENEQLSAYLESYPELNDMTKEQVVYCTGNELYIIYPADSAIKLTIYENFIDEENDFAECKCNILYSNSGEPILLKCNVSDIIPNVIVRIEGDDGEFIEFSPFISLKDGTLSLPEGGLVKDMTIYK